MYRFFVLFCCMELAVAFCRCPRNWVEYGRKCYQVGTDRLTWQEAQEKCISLHKGARLAVIENAVEYDWLKKIIKTAQVNDSCYLGGNDRTCEGYWQWDRTDVSFESNQHYWATGQPDNRMGNEDCLVMRHSSFKWKDVTCNLRFHYVCEFKVGCPHNWAPFRGKCYKMSSDKLTWKKAQKRCNQLQENAHLAVIENAIENEWIKMLVHATVKDQTYIGGSDRANEGHWEWTGTDVPFKFQDWRVGQPDNSRHREDCLHLILPDYKWNDIKCRRKLHYICQVTECPDNWIPFGRKCYKVGEDRLNWKEAKVRCGQLHENAHLAIIENDQENDWLQKLASRPNVKYSIYLGGSDLECEQDWRWVNTDVPFKFKPQYWAKNQPDNLEHREHCLVMKNKPVTINGKCYYKWNDVSCDNKFQYVCEIKVH